jgi:glycosyltransferase involved in cell wall biosynthesis
MSTAPVLSVVVVTDGYETIRKTLRHVAAQAIAARIELVVVVPRGVAIPRDEPELAGLWGVQVVEIESIESLSWARAPGIQAATAPVVVLTESHVYPEPGWAEALLAAVDEGWAVVGPGVTNANPNSVVSWANLFIDYGPWIGGGRRELVDLPGHNSAYRREVLVELGDELGELLEAEYFMHARLRERGHRLLLEPAARMRHVNVSRLGSLLLERYNTGRRFGGARGRTFSPARRLLYAVGSPLIPLVRLPRILRDVERSGLRGELLPRMLPALLFGLVVSACGELVGYLAGPGDSMLHLSRIELHKERYLGRGDALVLPGLDAA